MQVGMSSFRVARFGALMLAGAALSGCFGGGDDDAYNEAPPPPVRSSTSALPSSLPVERGTNHVESQPGQVALQCVPYAREHSAIKISGDANTWWGKAAGKYERGASPAAGTVMVLYNYAGSGSGHVAVVRRIVSSREIRIDHANWLNDGSIYVNDPVVDVSAANDWSQVKVWNIKTGGWGTKIFPVQGFIGPGSDTAPGGREAPGSGDQMISRRDVYAPQDHEDDAATPPDDLVADNTNDDAPPPVQRIAVAAPARPKSRPVKAVAVKAANPVIPAALADDDRNPAPGSAFALTDEDRAIP